MDIGEIPTGIKIKKTTYDVVGGGRSGNNFMFVGVGVCCLAFLMLLSFLLSLVVIYVLATHPNLPNTATAMRYETLTTVVPLKTIQVNQLVSDSTLLPEFDNLYLDMNGMIHGCTHGDDSTESQKLSDRDMFLQLFHYIDRIVSQTVRPQKLLYMAIDGVAPRAKMNQQRSRRFCSAKDAKALRERLVEEGQSVLDEGEIFDSNCITPGTEFLAKVSKYLQYFICKKINEDPYWSRLKIIFSGHDVPGEGEHKIMQYIRDERHSGRLPPNTRHCMYGQDADLIMLGLITHEPHFILLREVVNFGSFNARQPKNAVKVIVKNTGGAVFQLLHLSILREYIFLEMSQGIRNNLKLLPTCLERWIDDFIFLTFLIGNDFLPHMPSLDIGEHAIPLLLDVYRSCWPNWGGEYLTKDGSIDSAERLEEYFCIIGSMEDEIFNKREEKEATFRGKQQRRFRDVNRRSGFSASEALITEEELHEQEAEKQYRYEAALAERGCRSSSSTITESGQKDFKGRYYFEKFGFLPADTDMHNHLQMCYLEGLQWCMAYYYKGCISWSWFFPFHYVPLISDLKGLAKHLAQVKFILGAPFKPFEQLLSCLPPLSSWCLPKCYAKLMTSLDSPVHEFYPEDIAIDPNGKRNPWEFVILLPFIDASRLFQAVSQHCKEDQLSKEERARNTFGQVLEFCFDDSLVGGGKTMLGINPDIGLGDIQKCNVRVTPHSYCIESFTSFTSEIRPGTVMPYPGFPSFHGLDLPKADFRTIKLNVFGAESRYETVVLTLNKLQKLNDLELDKLAMHAIGTQCYVNWPCGHESKIVSLSNGTVEISKMNDESLVKRTRTEREVETWKIKTAAEVASYFKGRGTPGSGGVEIGNIDIMVNVLPLQGMKSDSKTGALVKVFGTDEATVPLQLIMWESLNPDPRFEERGPVPLLELFVPGSLVLCLGSGEYRGCQGIVKREDDRGNLIVEVQVTPPEPPFGLNIARSVADDYITAGNVCAIVGLNPRVLGRIVGSYFVDPGRFDIGLNLKSKSFYLLGYARPVLRNEWCCKSAWTTRNTVQVVGSTSTTAFTENLELAGWEFSKEAISLVINYMKNFPLLFQGLESAPMDRPANASELLGPGREPMLQGILAWLHETPTGKLPRIPITSSVLCRNAVCAIERTADVRQRIILHKTISKVFHLPPEVLFRSRSVDSMLANQDIEDGVLKKQPSLGDRVVNICGQGVPFGLRGNVVGLHPDTGCVEVVFDEEFIGGSNLSGVCSNYRGCLLPYTKVALIPSSVKIVKSSHSLSHATARSNKSSAKKNKPAVKSNISAVAPKKEIVQKSKYEAAVSPSLTSELKNSLGLLSSGDRIALECNGGSIVVEDKHEVKAVMISASTEHGDLPISVKDRQTMVAERGNMSNKYTADLLKSSKLEDMLGLKRTDKKETSISILSEKGINPELKADTVVREPSVLNTTEPKSNMKGTAVSAPLVPSKILHKKLLYSKKTDKGDPMRLSGEEHVELRTEPKSTAKGTTVSVPLASSEQLKDVLGIKPELKKDTVVREPGVLNTTKPKSTMKGIAGSTPLVPSKILRKKLLHSKKMDKEDAMRLSGEEHVELRTEPKSTVKGTTISVPSASPEQLKDVLGIKPELKEDTVVREPSLLNTTEPKSTLKGTTVSTPSALSEQLKDVLGITMTDKKETSISISNEKVIEPESNEDTTVFTSMPLDPDLHAAITETKSSTVKEMAVITPPLPSKILAKKIIDSSTSGRNVAETVDDAALTDAQANKEAAIKEYRVPEQSACSPVKKWDSRGVRPVHCIFALGPEAGKGFTAGRGRSTYNSVGTAEVATAMELGSLEFTHANPEISPIEIKNRNHSFLLDSVQATIEEVEGVLEDICTEDY